MHSLDVVFFFQAEDGIRDLVRSRGLGDVYKRQHPHRYNSSSPHTYLVIPAKAGIQNHRMRFRDWIPCLLYTSDAADERSSVDLGGRRIIKKKNNRATQAQSIELKQTRQHTKISIHMRNLKKK